MKHQTTETCDVYPSRVFGEPFASPSGSDFIEAPAREVRDGVAKRSSLVEGLKKSLRWMGHHYLLTTHARAMGMAD